MNKIPVNVIKTHPALPDLSYTTSGSAGFNLPVFPENFLTSLEASASLDDLGGEIIPPDEHRRYTSGYKIQLAGQSEVMLVLPRSGLGSAGCVLKNLVGVIDQDYQGELFITLWNTGSKPLVVNFGKIFFQALIVPCFQGDFAYMKTFPQPSERGERGHGQATADLLGR